MYTKRIASILLVCLLVTAGVAGPMAQPAVAVEAGDCSSLDDFVMFATVGLVNVEDCSREAYVQDAIADYEQTDAEQTKVDIYSEGQSAKQGADNYIAPFGNYLQDSETVAWSKMQVAVAEAYQNGSTEAQARYEAEKAIEEYYAVKQRNLAAQWNTHVTTMGRVNRQKQMESNISSSFIRMSTEGGWSAADLASTGNNSYTLINGTSVTVEYLRAPEGNTDPTTIRFSQTTGYYSPGGAGDKTYKAIKIKPPTSSYSSVQAFNATPYRQANQEIIDSNSALISEAKNFVNATYSDFESGEANASDVISANTAMFEYGPRSGDDTESLYNSVGALSLMGFDTPDLNSSGTMTVGYQNQEYTGIVMARNAPNGSWQANTTYDSANIDGPVFLATTAGEKVELDGEFRINELRAKDGSSIDSVNTTQYAYKTANATELMEMQSRLSSLRAEIEEREPTAGGGGGTSGGSIPTPVLFGGIGAVLALLAAIAITKD